MHTDAHQAMPDAIVGGFGQSQQPLTGSTEGNRAVSFQVKGPPLSPVTSIYTQFLGSWDICPCNSLWPLASNA